MAIYRPPEYPFAFDADLRPYITRHMGYPDKPANITPMIGDDSRLVRWYSPWLDRDLPRTLRPGNGNYSVATQKIIELALQHFGMLQESGSPVVNTDYRLSERGVPGNLVNPGIIFAVDKLPGRMRSTRSAPPAVHAEICQPFGRYLSQVMEVGNLALSDVPYAAQYTYDPESKDKPMVHDTEPRFTEIRGSNGDFTTHFRVLLRDLATLEQTAGLENGYATLQVAKAA
jgi:hypothetical protein